MEAFFIYHNNDNKGDPMEGQKGPDGKKPKNMLFFASHQKEDPICDRLRISFIV